MGNCQKNKKPKERTGTVRLSNHQSEGKKLEAKIVLIGSTGVGKTSIAQRYKEGRISTQTKATIGASYFKKTVHFKDSSSLDLHIWDTAGQERYQAQAPLYYKGAHAALIVYSVTDDTSFMSLNDWVNQLEEHNNV